MVSESVQEPVVSEAPSEESESPSEPNPFEPSIEDVQEGEVQDENTEALSDDVEEEPVAPAPPTVESALEKRKSLERGDSDVSLSAEEYRLLREHDRAEDNRRRDYERNQQERQQQLKMLTEVFDRNKTEITGKVMELADWVSRLGSIDDPVTKDNVTQSVSRMIDGIRDDAYNIVMTPHLEQQRTAIKSALGQNAGVNELKTVDQLPDQMSIIGYVWQMGDASGYERGLQAGIPEGMELVTKREADTRRRADRTASKAGPNGSVPPAGGRSANGRIPTVSQWSGYSFDQRQAALKSDPDIERKIMEAGR